MSARVNFRRIRLPWIAAIAGALLLIPIFILLLGGHQKLKTNINKATQPWLNAPGIPSHSNLQSIFKHLHNPAIGPDATSYRSYGGQEWQIDGDPLWTKSLGEKLCIIDLDNRVWDEKGQLFNGGPINWDAALGLSLGTLNHYLYASIHGYKYYYIRTETPEDRRPSWRKPPIIAKILKQHDVCIYADSDAIFNHLDLPFEFLLNYWRIVPGQTAMSMALDPKHPNNEDQFGRVYLNTGFIIAQNIPRTFDILAAWSACPDAKPGTKYEKCKDYRTAEPGQGTDQAAMGNFIRYDFEEKEDIRELPCTEANGFPQSHSGCNGDFIRHLWTGKDDILRGAVGETLAGALLQSSHQSFLDGQPEFFMQEKDLLG